MNKKTTKNVVMGVTVAAVIGQIVNLIYLMYWSDFYFLFFLFAFPPVIGLVLLLIYFASGKKQFLLVSMAMVTIPNIICYFIIFPEEDVPPDIFGSALALVALELFVYFGTNSKAEESKIPTQFPYMPNMPVAPVQTKEKNLDVLYQYKELLDSGVISKEEFDAKKRDILGM